MLVEFSGTIGAEPVGQLSIEMNLDVYLHLMPVTPVIADAFAGWTDWEKTSEQGNVSKGILELRLKSLFRQLRFFTTTNLFDQIPVPAPCIPGDCRQEKHHHRKEYVKPGCVVMIEPGDNLVDLIEVQGEDEDNGNEKNNRDSVLK